MVGQRGIGGSLDVRGLGLVYCTTTPGLTAPLRGAHATARPVFYGAVPAAWIGAGISQDPSLVAAAYRLTVTQGLTLGLVVGTKHAVGRSRPYVDHPLAARADRHTPPAPGEAYLSFPSGHTGLSAALVTSWSLSYPRWYVIGPGALWATGVALSRVYLLVHQLRRLVTPPSLRASSGAQQVRAAPLVLRIQF
ncbi:MAG: PAP2 family protein [Bacteroidetes bacterium QH_7_64_110]|nr:MAG: PAP2 family protein [Bacteroidetes bacterium QH_7_64_110]